MGWIYLANTRLWSSKPKNPPMLKTINHLTINDTKDNQPNNPRKLSCVPMKTTSIPFLLKTVISMEQIGSDMQKYTGWYLWDSIVLWVQCRPWLLPGKLGRHTSGFPWGQGHLCTNLDVIPTTLPSIQAWWTKRSAFHWYDHLAVILCFQ